MVATLDILSPVFVGEDRITLTVNENSKPLLSFKIITINVNYDLAGEEGISLPLEFILQPGFGGGGEANGYQQKIFRRTAPETISFTVPSAGQYLLLLREIHHNRWQGRLIMTVEGDQAGLEIVTER